MCLILTPSAARWWEPRMQEFVDLTGHPVRSQYKLPWEEDALPKATAMLVAPMSCTTLNKWGAGISDTLAGCRQRQCTWECQWRPCPISTGRRARSPRS
ncbi:hypothetical protein [Streptomyces sp. NPDC088812]|uniref:hypothetical protein n=1 Tax=Streptomyces sp. NPDC088812 TaxID=3365905 RepID=UPI0037F37107